MGSPSEIITERSAGIVDVAFNRPAKQNALTMNMYSAFADLLDNAVKDDGIRVVLVHGAGDSFTAGNDLGDSLKNPPALGNSPQERLIDALVNFDKPLVAAVHGAAVGSGTTMLTHFDFVYAGESATFQAPFVNLALVPEFGSSYSLSAQLGYISVPPRCFSWDCRSMPSGLWSSDS
jgi:enoyl-CoA hydratase/carnithine racemase